MKLKNLWLMLVGSLIVGCGDRIAEDTFCTVEGDADGTVTMTCPDGTTTILDGTTEELGPNSLGFLGVNDAPWGLALGNTQDADEVIIDDATVASAGAVILGGGSMRGTSFTVEDLQPGVYEVRFSVHWGIGINGDALTQRFRLSCAGGGVLYDNTAMVSAGDADAQGINDAHAVVLQAWIELTDESTMDCDLTKQILDVAQGGSGVLYNNLNSPTVARVSRIIPQ